MRLARTLAAVVAALLAVATAAHAGEAPANNWKKVAERTGGARMLVWSPKLKRLIFYSPGASLGTDGPAGYDFQSFDPTSGKWSNELPDAAKGRVGDDGAVRHVKHKTPYFAMKDGDDLVRPNPRQMRLYRHFALAPWDGCIYMLVCGRTLKYDPAKREWTSMEPKTAPMPQVKAPGASLCWSSMCADPVNKEILLFGGGGLWTPDGSPGTWVYSPEKNEWRKLAPKTPPPPRALPSMVYDPATKKIVLFGGDRLDMIYADTWVYDCGTREWEEKKPDLSPSPRFASVFVRMPKSGKLVLVGGKATSSKGGAYGGNHQSLPFDAWTYYVEKNEWSLLLRPASGADAPRAATFRAGNVAIQGDVADDDTIYVVGSGKERGGHSLWSLRLDPTKIDAAGTKELGVEPGTRGLRTGPYDPEWYTEDVPPPDPAKAAEILKNLPANEFVSIECPKWPKNRRGGGWSTTTIDTDRDQILNISGGHVAYFGSDVAHYDIRTNRWSISFRGSFPLEFCGGLDGPGSWGFDGAPWGNHNYHAYTYDPTLKRMVYVKDGWTIFYDPARKKWPHEEKFHAVPGNGSKYTTYLLSTPKGVVSWSNPNAGIHRLEGGKKWVALEKNGALPGVLCDGSAAVYDSKRDRLLMVSTTGDRKKAMPRGQVWSYDFKTGKAGPLNPVNRDALVCGRFAREAVYLPEDDVMLVGYRLKVGEKIVVPLYDCAKNQWLGAELKGSEIITSRLGCGVCLGLAYDPKRNLVWAVDCVLGRKKPGLRALRLDMKTLKAAPLGG
ncbi:MAG: Kelch repeat-containing protein [Planctomycetota bacterium]|jgi:hypothetical protein